MNGATEQHGATTPQPMAAKTAAGFMIVAQARSGSTLLREALNAEPEIICHGEVFSRVWIDRIVPPEGAPRPNADQIRALLPLRDADPLRFMADHVMGFPGKVAGFKIIYDDLIDQRFLEPLTGYARQNGLRIIHLRRLNPVAALASRTRMSRFGIAHSDMAPRQAGATSQRITIDPGELQRYIARQALLADQVDQIFPAALQARYETLQQDFARILAHLGLPADRPFRAPLRKLAPPDLGALIENYHQIRHYDVPEQPVWPSAT